MPQVSSVQKCPHCGIADMSEFLGPAAKAVEARGICSNCLRWYANGLAAYAPERSPMTEQEVLDGRLEINKAGAAAAAGGDSGSAAGG